ncbi:hypothetical protein MPH_06654, partial [Macrophomina phaseolina MS6]
ACGGVTLRSIDCLSKSIPGTAYLLAYWLPGLSFSGIFLTTSMLSVRTYCMTITTTPLFISGFVLFYFFGLSPDIFGAFAKRGYPPMDFFLLPELRISLAPRSPYPKSGTAFRLS